MTPTSVEPPEPTVTVPEARRLWRLYVARHVARVPRVADLAIGDYFDELERIITAKAAWAASRENRNPRR